ncbi:MAG: patatin-like phospholipase family protein [Bryobacterales bacterium]|nr:patatin-like phospholipase family protein [Bryobacterales bacterium]
MPFSSEGVAPGCALAVSGGGFRATLFHLGSLWRLNQLGFLPKLDRISSISGGSITAGYLAIKWNKLQFGASGYAPNFALEVVDPLRAFCSNNIDLIAIGESALLPWKKASDIVEAAYRDKLFGDANLQQLPESPRFVINATNFATGVSFRFSKPYAGDYRIGLIRNPKFRISQAVAASSAFPPVLSPVILEVDPESFEKTEGADLYDDAGFRKRLVLSDGGVYDNLGLETVWNRYQTVLVSDAGAPFSFECVPDTGWAQQAMRAMDIATNQSRGLRKRALIADFRSNARNGAYWGILTDILKYQAGEALPCPPAAIAELASLRTRLNAFSEREQCRLINWGYAVCDAALRSHMQAPNDPAAAWPYPNFALDRP